MPIIKSAKKQLKQDRVRTERNKVTKEAYKQAVKKIDQSVAKGKKVTPGAVSKAYQQIDKATKHNIIHRNKAARLKSRVSNYTRGNR